MHDFTDVTYEVQDGLAWICINRPERYNSFRARTVDELVLAFKRAWVTQQAFEWGLANKVVPADQLRKEVRAWADEILKLSPTALKVLKQSFNTDTEHFAGIGQMAYSGL